MAELQGTTGYEAKEEVGGGGEQAACRLHRQLPPTSRRPGAFLCGCGSAAAAVAVAAAVAEEDEDEDATTTTKSQMVPLACVLGPFPWCFQDRADAAAWVLKTNGREARSGVGK